MAGDLIRSPAIGVLGSEAVTATVAVVTLGVVVNRVRIQVHRGPPRCGDVMTPTTVSRLSDQRNRPLERAS